MKNVRLTIIIPTFNSEKTLYNTLKSVVNQNFHDFECWIVDGKSTDSTLAIIEKFCDKYVFIKFVSEPDKGIYDAMNKGIELAQGDYLYFMGSDDVFYSNQILTEIFFEEREQADLIYGDIVFKHSHSRYGEEKNYLKLIKNLENICHQSIFYSKKVFDMIGKYDLRYQIYADFNLNIKCFKNDSISKKYIPKIVCVFNEKGTSYSKRKRDSYIKDVHELYVNNYEDKVALYDTVRLLENDIAQLYQSKDYLVGKKIGNLFRVIKSKLSGKTW